MESGREEAIRAKEAAEKKLDEQDIDAAIGFASRAYSLFPDLEGLLQIFATIDVYTASEKKVNGEIDWYKVLGVGPVADYQAMRERYRKLARALHPDKNKSFRSDGAFKLLTQAWSVLSDKDRRQKYDLKRNASAMIANGLKTSVNKSDSISARKRKSLANPEVGPSAIRPSKPEAFWTVCCTCSFQYEYPRVYICGRLRCPNCSKAFIAVEIPMYTNPMPYSSKETCITLKCGKITIAQHGPLSKSVATAAHVVQPARANLKRGCEGDQTAGVPWKKIHHSMKPDAIVAHHAVFGPGKRGRPRKKVCIDERKNTNSNTKVSVNDHVAIGAGEAGSSKGNNPKNLSKVETSEMLAGKVSVSAAAHRATLKRGYAGDQTPAIILALPALSSSGKRGRPKKKVCVYELKDNNCNTKVSANDPVATGAGSSKGNSPKNLSKEETSEMLVGKAKAEIHKKLNEWNAAAAAAAAAVAGDLEKFTLDSPEKDVNVKKPSWTPMQQVIGHAKDQDELEKIQKGKEKKTADGGDIDMENGEEEKKTQKKQMEENISEGINGC